MKENNLNRNNSEFLNAYVSVDVVLFIVHDEKLQVLLINRESDPFKGNWALPGGFPLKGETTKDTAKRILKEKVGLKDSLYIEQLYTFDTIGRDPRDNVFSVTYFALVPFETFQHIDSKHSQQPTLFDIKKLPVIAFDHKDIITYAVKRLRAKLGYTNVAYSALPRYFTFSMLQSIYEIILEQTMDKRNFRKMIEQLEIIEPTEKKLQGMKQRPALLYEFKKKSIVDVKQFL